MIFRAVEDTDLIRQAARGGVEAYNLLVSRWEKRVYNYLLRITGNREDALDLAQDVFLKAYQNLRKLDDPGRFAPWLYRIAHNEAYSMFRKRKPESDAPDAQIGRAQKHVQQVQAAQRLYPGEALERCRQVHGESYKKIDHSVEGASRRDPHVENDPAAARHPSRGLWLLPPSLRG